MMMNKRPISDPSPARGDPVNPNVNNMGDATGRGAGQHLPGTQGSMAQLRRGGLIKTRTI